MPMNPGFDTAERLLASSVRSNQVENARTMALQAVGYTFLGLGWEIAGFLNRNAPRGK